MARKMSSRIETVKTFLIFGGSTRLTSAAMKIPEQTIYQWRRQEWWHELERELKQQENMQLSARLKKIVERSLDVVADRLENGDFIYDQKTGEMRRKPVAMKDAHKVAIDSNTQRQLLEQNENFVVAQEQVQDKLAKLAEAFASLSKPKVEVTDVVFVEEAPKTLLPDEIEYDDETGEDNALHEGREA